MEMRKCARPDCPEPWKPLSEFGSKKGAKGGKNPWCKDCVNRLDKVSRLKRSNNAPNLDITEKWCAGHERIEPIGRFGKDSKVSDGYRRVCKEWNNAQQREYAERNPDVIQRNKVIWGQSEVKKEYDRQYASEHRQEARERSTKHYEDNREEKLTYASERRKTEEGKASGARARHIRRDRMATCDFTTTWLFEQRAAATICARCTVPLTRDDHLAPTYLTLEHIIPLNEKGGGLNVMANLTFTCRQCNGRRPKDGRDIILWASSVQSREVTLFLA